MKKAQFLLVSGLISIIASIFILLIADRAEGATINTRCSAPVISPPTIDDDGIFPIMTAVVIVHCTATKPINVWFKVDSAAFWTRPITGGGLAKRLPEVKRPYEQLKPQPFAKGFRYSKTVILTVPVKRAPKLKRVWQTVLQSEFLLQFPPKFTPRAVKRTLRAISAQRAYNYR